MNPPVRRSVADWRRSSATDRGDTLLEVLISVAIMGIAGAAVMAGFGSSIVLSAVHRKLATTGSDGRNFGELLVKAIDTKAIAYTPCASPGAYASPPGFTAGPNNTATVTAVHYWNGTSFGASCSVATDQGIQRVSVSVTNTDTRALSTIQIVVRKPCTLLDVTAGPCP